jgi:hypothetical protein
MALKLRPTGLGPGIDKDRQDYTVYTGGWDIGGSYETRGGPERLRWFWSFAVQGPMTRGSSSDLRGSKGGVSEELGSLEGVGEAGRASLAAASILQELNIGARIDGRASRHINLRVWDAGRPRWVSPFAGASSAAQRESPEPGLRTCPVSNPKGGMWPVVGLAQVQESGSTGGGVGRSK